MQGDTAKARTAHQDFLTLWKDAEPDIPILIPLLKSFPHPAATQLLDDAVVRNGLADQFERHSNLGRQS
jgi:hypothetical protein